MRCGEDKMTLGTKIAHILCFSEEDCDTMLPPDYDMRVEKQKEEHIGNFPRRKDFGEMEEESHEPTPNVKLIYKDCGTHKVEHSYIEMPIKMFPQMPQNATEDVKGVKFVYGSDRSRDSVVHLHKDGAKVPDITVISPYDPGSDGWKHDIDFLSEFQEVSKGVPIGKYEVVPED